MQRLFLACEESFVNLLQTVRENHSAFHKIWFRPRVLVDVEHVDMSTTMLGTKVDIPFYVTATALGKLGHPEGEVVLTRGAKKHNVIQMIPTLASCSFDEIMDAADDQVQWLQLYVNKDREVTKRIVQHAEKRGCKVSSDRLVRLIVAKFSKGSLYHR